MKYVIDVPEEMITSSGELMFYYKNTKDLTYQMYTGINVMPYTDITKDNPVHLCESCNRMHSLVSCPANDDDSLFGEDGKSICCCKHYVPETTDRKAVENAQNQGWKFANDIINGLNIYECRECFGYGLLPDILNSMSYQEAVDHFETWKTERNDLIKVGDGIINKTTYDKAIIVGMEMEDELYVCMSNDGISSLSKFELNEMWVKTGDTYPEAPKLFDLVRTGLGDAKPLGF